VALELPIPIDEYVKARNAFDVDATLAPFDENAIVMDEDQEYRGRATIRAWIEDTTSRYHAKIEPKELHEDDGQTIVVGLVSGDFPGSPILLDHACTLAGGHITRLEIS
jgi:hypothetical protein